MLCKCSGGVSDGVGSKEGVEKGCGGISGVGVCGVTCGGHGSPVGQPGGGAIVAIVVAVGRIATGDEVAMALGVLCGDWNTPDVDIEPIEMIASSGDKLRNSNKKPPVTINRVAIITRFSRRARDFIWGA